MKKTFTPTELNQTTFPEFRERVMKVESEGVDHSARSYPGYPTWALKKCKPRVFTQLDNALLKRRSIRDLASTPIGKSDLSRLLQFSHGITAHQNRGPVPSSGELQSLELYLVNLASDWLPSGVYHYDRVGHHLSQIKENASRKEWDKIIPSTVQFQGGSLFWIIVGDGRRVEHKYGERGYRFLSLEAGHLMQNLCLLSVGLGLCTLPLGGFFEQNISQELCLLPTDLVLYLGICGKIKINE